MTALEWKERPDAVGIWLQSECGGPPALCAVRFLFERDLPRYAEPNRAFGPWLHVAPVSAVEAAVAEERRALLAALPGRAHTYASENGDHYMGFDAGIEHVRLTLLARAAQWETKQ